METNFEQEKLTHLLRYAAYAERCSYKNEIPILFQEWRELTTGEVKKTNDPFQYIADSIFKLHNKKQ